MITFVMKLFYDKYFPATDKIGYINNIPTCILYIYIYIFYKKFIYTHMMSQC